MQPKPKKGYTISEMGKPQKLSDRTMRQKEMSNQLNKLMAERKKKGGVSNLSEWPSTPKGLYKTKKK